MATLRRPNQEKTLVCADCGSEFTARMASAKRCPDCRVLERKAHLEAFNAKQLGVPADRLLECQGCGEGFRAHRSDAKWCPVCKAKKVLEHGSRYRPERVHIGAEKRCTQCGEPFEGSAHAAFCATCREVRHVQAVLRSRAKLDRSLCPKCGGSKRRNSKFCRSCSSPANLPDDVRRGERHPNWGSGRFIDKAGYWNVRLRRANGTAHYRREHLVVWEAANGALPSGHSIHHINGDKLDNRLENLVCLTISAHTKMHHDVDRVRSKQIQHHESRAEALERENEQLRARLRELGEQP